MGCMCAQYNSYYVKYFIIKIKVCCDREIIYLAIFYSYQYMYIHVII